MKYYSWGFKGDEKPNMLRGHIPYVFVLVAFILTFNEYQGDSVISLLFARNIADGYWFQFNPGEFSSGATSPLWSVILAPLFVFAKPWIWWKFLSLGMMLLALWVTFREFGDELVTIPYLFYLTTPALTGYETPLAVILVTLMIRWTFYQPSRWVWLAWVCLPLLRPEAIVIVLMSMCITPEIKRKWIAFIPIIAYWGVSYIETGYFSTSIVFRAEFAQREPWFWMQRYALVFFPFLAMWLHRTLKRWNLTATDRWVLLLFGIALSSLKLAKPIGYSWEEVTNKENASRLTGSGYVLLWEVQDKWYMSDSLKVISEEGILDGKIGMGKDSVIARYKPLYQQKEDRAGGFHGGYRPFKEFIR